MSRPWCIEYEAALYNLLSRKNIAAIFLLSRKIVTRFLRNRRRDVLLYCIWTMGPLMEMNKSVNYWSELFRCESRIKIGKI
jgi:hypothetical protein